MLGGIERIVSWEAARSTGGRAARYREQAGRFEQMAEDQLDEKVRTKLFDLADQYQALAASLSENRHDLLAVAPTRKDRLIDRSGGIGA